MCNIGEHSVLNALDELVQEFKLTTDLRKTCANLKHSEQAGEHRSHR
jgi:hypothetical protein